MKTMAFGTGLVTLLAAMMLPVDGRLDISGTENSTCQFGPGICPVEIDNVVDVFYFDVADGFSCQEHCMDLEDCKFFSMYGVKDSPKDHMKCFAFKSCDHLDPCDECTTGMMTLKKTFKYTYVFLM